MLRHGYISQVQVHKLEKQSELNSATTKAITGTTAGGRNKTVEHKRKINGKQWEFYWPDITRTNCGPHHTAKTGLPMGSHLHVIPPWDSPRQPNRNNKGEYCEWSTLEIVPAQSYDIWYAMNVPNDRFFLVSVSHRNHLMAIKRHFFFFLDFRIVTCLIAHGINFNSSYILKF